MANSKPLLVSLIHDDKTGHRKQLEALAKQLEELFNAQCNWHHYTSALKELKNLAPYPALVIGAGHKTHWPVFRAARSTTAKSCIIMSPSLPTAMFDYVIAPLHDGLTPSDRILCTQGPINTIQPKNTDCSLENEGSSLLLIGGLSRHFHWSPESIIRQIEILLQERSEQQFLCFTSRRTPESTKSALREIENPALQLITTNDDQQYDLDQALSFAKDVFVTPDSISMIYEALTAGTSVRLFDLKQKQRWGKTSKVAAEINRLKREQLVSNLLDPPARKLGTQIWSAREAAIWLASKFGLTLGQDEGNA